MLQRILPDPLHVIGRAWLKKMCSDSLSTLPAVRLPAPDRGPAGRRGDWEGVVLTMLPGGDRSGVDVTLLIRPRSGATRLHRSFTFSKPACHTRRDISRYHGVCRARRVFSPLASSGRRRSQRPVAPQAGAGPRGPPGQDDRRPRRARGDRVPGPVRGGHRGPRRAATVPDAFGHPSAAGVGVGAPALDERLRGARGYPGPPVDLASESRRRGEGSGDGRGTLLLEAPEPFRVLGIRLVHHSIPRRLGPNLGEGRSAVGPGARVREQLYAVGGGC
jgi:hypothetical protein